MSITGDEPASHLPKPTSSEAELWMRQALAEAESAADAGEVPIGAVVMHMVTEPQVIGTGFNRREQLQDPTAHAEILALRSASKHLGRWRLQDCLLVVTLEPCPMCAGALWASRIGGVVQGASNDEAGALGTFYNLGQDPRLNHEFPVQRDILEQECSHLLRSFFEQRRNRT